MEDLFQHNNSSDRAGKLCDDGSNTWWRLSGSTDQTWIQDYKINLSYIDSRPSKTKFGEYTFFVDFDGHVSDETVAKAIEEIKTHTHYYRLIGSFERV